MLKRTITGLFILIVVAGFTALRLVHPLFFDALALVIMYGSITEMVLSCKFSNRKVSKIVVAVYPIALLCIYLFTNSVEQALLYQLLAILAVFVVLMTKELIQNAVNRKKLETIQDEKEINASLLVETKTTLELIIYPVTLLGFLIGINHYGLNLGFVGIIMSFAISMSTDVFAYLFGSMIKGVRLAPEISPKKSVAGMVFGALGGVVAAGLGYLFFVRFGWFGDVFSNIELTKQILLFVGMGLIGTFLTQFGDLVASAYKRKVGIKDFGAVFPGHGGFMDRVDGLMFTTALVYILFALII